MGEVSVAFSERGAPGRSVPIQSKSSCITGGDCIAPAFSGMTCFYLLLLDPNPSPFLACSL